MMEISISLARLSYGFYDIVYVNKYTIPTCKYQYILIESNEDNIKMFRENKIKMLWTNCLRSESALQFWSGVC